MSDTIRPFGTNLKRHLLLCLQSNLVIFCEYHVKMDDPSLSQAISCTFLGALGDPDVRGCGLPRGRATIRFQCRESYNLRIWTRWKNTCPKDDILLDKLCQIRRPERTAITGIVRVSLSSCSFVCRVAHFVKTFAVFQTRDDIGAVHWPRFRETNSEMEYFGLQLRAKGDIAMTNPYKETCDFFDQLDSYAQHSLLPWRLFVFRHKKRPTYLVHSYIREI